MYASLCLRSSAPRGAEEATHPKGGCILTLYKRAALMAKVIVHAKAKASAPFNSKVLLYSPNSGPNWPA
jgi:hypothetical protein